MRHGRAMLLAAAIIASPAATRAHGPETEIMPPEAHMLAAAGAIVLIDIRRPDEWFETGVPEHAHAIRGDGPLFAEKLEALTGGRRNVQVALICTVGMRTKALQQKLTESGYTNIISVRGGLTGGGGEKGWIGYRLPMVEGP
ncbi:MAG: rhodanese-like domain-containing protein [Beijerinckiaceae bacterium]